MSGAITVMEPNRKRVYQLWKGTNKFILGGRVILGPDAKSVVVTLLLIIVPVVVFCVFVAWHFRHNLGYAVLVAPIAFTLYVVGLLGVTSCRDPGIIPRNLHPPEEDMRYESTSSTMTPTLQLPRTKEVTLDNGLSLKLKYCDTCMLYRPPRCSHCSICNNCVERFDHHCPWVGQCIGLRNYRYFFMFVSSSTLLCIYVFAFSAYYVNILMKQHQSSVWTAMKRSPPSVILMAYCFVSLWFVGGLTAFHLYLIASNQTTYENFRYRADNKMNAYNRGCIHNFIQVFCTKGKPSRNHFRAFVQQEVVQRGPRLASPRETDRDEIVDARSKVEDDLEMGEDFLKISQRRNFEEMDVDLNSRGSNGPPHNTSELDSVLGSDHRAPTIRSETRHSSWARRSGSWEIAPDDVLSNSNATAPREAPQ